MYRILPSKYSCLARKDNNWTITIKMLCFKQQRPDVVKPLGKVQQTNWLSKIYPLFLFEPCINLGIQNPNTQINTVPKYLKCLTLLFWTVTFTRGRIMIQTQRNSSLHSIVFPSYHVVLRNTRWQILLTLNYTEMEKIYSIRNTPSKMGTIFMSKYEWSKYLL